MIYPFYAFQNLKVFKPIATGKVRNENINFESDRASSMTVKIQTKQSLLSSTFQAGIRYLAIKPTQQVAYMNT